jgi:hypothetical protein
MKPLTIELTKGTQRQLQSIGWKTPKGDDCRRHFFAVDQTGKPVVATPKPAMPNFYDPTRRAKAVFSCEPFPEAVCVEISPCRLLAPPCYQSREEFESQLPGHYHFKPWRAIYWETHRHPSRDQMNLAWCRGHGRKMISFHNKAVDSHTARIHRHSFLVILFGQPRQGLGMVVGLCNFN